jgi:hypothetical protein
MTHTPPRLAEVLLERLLAERDRDPVVGDLREEYGEGVYPRLGRMRANVWYLRQVWSLAPRFFSGGGPMGKALLPLSWFTLACACWLGAMEMLLRHPGYGVRVGVAALIGLIGAGTILARWKGWGLRGDRRLWPGAVVLMGIGGQAFLRNARAAHFEGFVLVISVALVAQGLLMVVAGIGRKGPSSPSRGTMPRLAGE